MPRPYDMESRPSAQEAVKRISSGFSLSESSNYVMSAKDDKSLKLATFSLQGYLKVIMSIHKGKKEKTKLALHRKKNLQQSF